MGAYEAARRHHDPTPLQEEDHAGEAPSAALGQGERGKEQGARSKNREQP